MAINSYFFNALPDGSGGYDRVYNADDITGYLDLLVSTGVFANPANNLQVVARGNMNITVEAGSAWINGYKMVNTADYPLTIDGADLLMNRIDSVIVFWDANTRTMGLQVKKGANAANPVAPELVRNGTRYELQLATVAVNKQATAITQANIKDTRGNSNVCGWVAGLIEQIDSAGLFAQYDSAFEQAITRNENEWEDWFTQVKDELATKTLLSKLEYLITTGASTVSTITVTDYIPNYKYTIDILEVWIDGLRLSSNEFDNYMGVVTLTTPVTHSGAEIALVVYKSIDGSDAETVVTQVTEMYNWYSVYKNGVYIATGTNDNGKLSQIVQSFLNGGNDYQQLQIDVYGEMAIAEPCATVGGVDYWFNFWASANTERRIRLDFSHAERITLDNTEYDNVVFVSAANTEILNLQAVMNNCVTAKMVENDATCTNCAFWMNGTGAGQLTGATRGTFENCRMSVTNASGKAYGFSADGNTLKLFNCEILAYNASGSANESVAVQVQGNMTTNVLIMTNCKCPITARSGYKQSNVVKINSGLYALMGNYLGKAALKYATGEGMAEMATMYQNGGGLSYEGALAVTASSDGAGNVTLSGMNA